MKRLLTHGARRFPVALLAVATLVGYSYCIAEEGDRESVGRSATPSAVIEAYHNAIEEKDWRTCFLCLGTEKRGDHLQRLFFAMAVTEDRQLLAIVKKHLQIANADEVDGVLGPAVKQVEGHPVLDHVLLYETLKRHTGNVPAFVEEFCRRLDQMDQKAFEEFGRVKQIEVQSGRAIAYCEPPPRSFDIIGPAESWSPGVLVESPPKIEQSYLPYPRGPLLDQLVYLRKVGGSWYLVDPPDNDAIKGRPVRSKVLR